MARKFEMKAEGHFLEGSVNQVVTVKVHQRIPSGVVLRVHNQAPHQPYSTLVHLTPYMARRLARALDSKVVARRKRGA